MAINKGTKRGANHGTTAGYGQGCRCDRCRKAKNRYFREWHNNRYANDPEYRASKIATTRKSIAKRAEKRRAELYDGHCSACGSTENLERDHVRPNTKEFIIGDGIWSKTDGQLDAELAKTQLLCRACHKSKHSLYRLPNGSIKAVMDSGKAKAPEGSVWVGFQVSYWTPLEPALIEAAF